MGRDPVLTAIDQADGSMRAWLGAVSSYVDHGRPTLVEVEELGVVAHCAWDEVKRVALKQPDEGSGERGL